MDSTTPIPISPLAFEPTYEITEEGEIETQAELIETLHRISETTFKDSGHATRSVHAKSHGLRKGALRVLDGLSPMFAQGILSKPGKWPVVMRLSTVPGDILDDILDDSVSTPRGLAIKIVGVSIRFRKIGLSTTGNLSQRRCNQGFDVARHC